MNENEYSTFNKDVSDIKYQKLYLINIIILSNCIDIISQHSYEDAAAFILSGKNLYIPIFIMLSIIMI